MYIVSHHKQKYRLQHQPYLQLVKFLFVLVSSIEQSEEMKIAWRYQNQPSASSNDNSSTSSHQFNLQKTLNKNIIEKCNVSSWY